MLPPQSGTSVTMSVFTITPTALSTTVTRRALFSGPCLPLPRFSAPGRVAAPQVFLPVPFEVLVVIILEPVQVPNADDVNQEPFRGCPTICVNEFVGKVRGVRNAPRLSLGAAESATRPSTRARSVIPRAISRPSTSCKGTAPGSLRPHRHSSSTTRTSL